MSNHFYLLLTIPLLPYFPVLGLLAFASCKGLAGTASPQTECARFVELRDVNFFFQFTTFLTIQRYEIQPVAGIGNTRHQEMNLLLLFFFVFLDIDG